MNPVKSYIGNVDVVLQRKQIIYFQKKMFRQNVVSDNAFLTVMSLTLFRLTSY